jgi:hypothetical protein
MNARLMPPKTLSPLDAEVDSLATEPAGESRLLRAEQSFTKELDNG